MLGYLSEHRPAPGRMDGNPEAGRDARRILSGRGLVRLLPRSTLVPTSKNSVEAKFGRALIQTAQHRRRGRKKRGGPLKGKGEEREDRPNAVTLLTLRLPRELRLCQLTITIYTRWPFLETNLELRKAEVRRIYLPKLFGK